MDWRDIPSLSALRAFEAVARLGSFSAAADELNVTHAAIAQHVRKIEAELNTPLARREGKGMALTPAGLTLQAALSDGFGRIVAGVRSVAAESADGPLTVSVTPNFAENWLMPRFAAFCDAHPGFDLAIRPSVDVLDLRREGIPLAVRYGYGNWPGLDATFLLPADFTVVAAPSLIADRKVETISDLAGLPWLFETLYGEARRWVEEAGITPAVGSITEMPSFGMVMSAVRAGRFLTIASSALAAEDIAAGRLVALMKHQPEGLGYYIVHPKGVLSDKARQFRSWLLRAAKG